jgi:hypothetical protein
MNRCPDRAPDDSPAAGGRHDGGIATIGAIEPPASRPEPVGRRDIHPERQHDETSGDPTWAGGGGVAPRHGPPAPTATIRTLFHSGVDNNGAVRPGGSKDPHDTVSPGSSPFIVGNREGTATSAWLSATPDAFLRAEQFENGRAVGGMVIEVRMGR